MKQFFLRLKKIFLKRKKIYLPLLFLLISIMAVEISLYAQQKQTTVDTQAQSILPLQVNLLEPGSGIQNTSDVHHVALYKTQGSLYQTQTSSLTGANEFIQQDPRIQSIGALIQPGVLVQNVSNNSQVIPNNFAANSELVRTLNDKDSTYLKTHGASSTNEHFFYNQTINDIPLYGATLGVHMKNGNQVYALDGSLSSSTTVEQKTISANNAKDIAMQKATAEKTGDITLAVVDTKEYIFNKAIVDMGSDTKNYPALAFTIRDNAKIPSFFSTYFVSLSDGSILFKEEHIHDALTRQIVDHRSCTDDSCPYARTEGQGAINDNDVDRTYDILGSVYTYYKNTFGRDSFNNQGSPLMGLVHLTTIPNFTCPNAAWVPTMPGQEANFLAICEGMVANDILGHEMTHAVAHTTANFIYEKQSGTLDEAIADIFGEGVDPSDWTMGEDSSIGIVRYLDDPTRSPRNPQPDRLFSPRYYCVASSATCNQTNDLCGVHINNGVINKMFYLITMGGNFNGCTMTGIGNEKSHAIVYHALTAYLTSTANFKNMYVAMKQSCSDLYQATSDTCIQVEKAMRAVEIDQQPDNQSLGASCVGIQRHEPNCNIVIPTPTMTPTASPTQISSPTTTPVPGIPTTTLAPTIPITNTPGSVHLPISLLLQPFASGSVVPQHANHLAIIQLYQPGTHTLVSENSFPITYNVTTYTFFGIGEFTVQPGAYDVRIAVPQYLIKILPNQTIRIGANTLPTTSLIVGDVNADNSLNILDYNMITQTCFGSRALQSQSCAIADLDENGKVDIFDTNLLFKNFLQRSGD